MTEEIDALFHPEKYEGCDFLARVSTEALEITRAHIYEQMIYWPKSEVLRGAVALIETELYERLFTED